MGHDSNTQSVTFSIKSPHSWMEQVDLQTVFNHFTNEVLKLHTPMLHYCSVTNSFQWVSFELCFYIADRPEYNASLNLLCHAGTTSKQCVHVATFKFTTLSSCDLCHESRVQYCQTGQTMWQHNNCTGWDIYDHSKVSAYCLLLHGDPTTQISNMEPPQHQTVTEHYFVPH